MAKKKPYRFFLYLFARGAAAIVSLLPRKFLLGFARWVGWLAYAIVTRQREKVLRHLGIAYGAEKSTEEIHVLAARVMESAAVTAAEWLQLGKITSETIDQFVDFGETLNVLSALKSEGKGTIAVTGHLGNWELLAGALALKGFPMTVVARRIYYEPYNRWIEAIRSSVKVKVVYRDDSPRELLAALRRNEIIGLLPDQDVDSVPGIFVPFFGRPAYTPVAPVKIALKTGAPIIGGFLIRQPDDRYKLVLQDVIRPVVETTYDDAVRKYTELWMAGFEEAIRCWPEQWVWMHNRWKTQPGKTQEQKKVVSQNL